MIFSYDPKWPDTPNVSLEPHVVREFMGKVIEHLKNQDEKLLEIYQLLNAIRKDLEG